ncbi:MAG: molybdenum ABC transporter ATP-binding protein [Pseudomonadota bacterium]
MNSDISAHFNLNLGGFNLDVAFTVPAQGVTALFGVSGAGKTTVLRCMAGLEKAQGWLRVQGEVWQDDKKFVPAHRRALGYVFQEPSLFPHLSVQRNLEYGYRRITPAARKVQLDQVVELLALQRLLARKTPAGLSGGEQQRVAIGRALLTSPQLLLMDEPLAALDAASKQEIMPYLQRVQRALQIPMFYVSHALDEVARLADHMLLLENGRVAASGGLNEVLSRLDLSTAHREDAGTMIEAQVAAHDLDYHLTRLDFNGGQLWINQVEHAIGTPVRACALARDVSIATTAPQGSSIANILAARIVEMRNEGLSQVSVRLLIGDRHMLLARITRRSCDQLGLSTGMEVFAQVKSVALVV